MPLEKPDLPDVSRFDAGRRAEHARALGNGRLVRIRAGVYAAPSSATGVAKRRREEVLVGVRAALEKLSAEFWFSHDTAVVLWGLWTWRLSGRVHVTHLRNPHVGRASEPTTARHWTSLPERDRVVWVDDGTGFVVPVTSLERTIVDCARTSPPDAALVVADAGLRLGADPVRVDALLGEAVGGRGVRGARRVVSMANGRSESPIESVTRWIVVDAGLPTPELAVEVGTRVGRCWVDLGWPELKVGIEVDGDEKYDGSYGDPRAVLAKEKRRHDALVEAGWLLIRVTFEDLRHPERVVARIVRALRSRGWRPTIPIPSRTGG